MLEILLASQSPRRRELLTSEGYRFQVFPVKVSEIIDENLNPPDVVSQIATVKAEAALDQCKDLNLNDYLILSADTLVVLGDQFLGKPSDSTEARDFLRRLSGVEHSVMTGLCLLEPRTSRRWSGVETSIVKFRKLSEAEIREYVESGEPMDKAGAYGFQGAARKFVETVEGSTSNIIGLPVELLKKALNENGWKVRRIE